MIDRSNDQCLDGPFFFFFLSYLFFSKLNFKFWNEFFKWKTWWYTNRPNKHTNTHTPNIVVVVIYFASSISNGIVLISQCLDIFCLLFQVQFLIVFVHTIQIQFQPTCSFPKSIGLLLTFNAGLFTYMFSSFYIRSYTRKHPSKSELNDVDRRNVCYSNGVTNTVDKLNNSIAEKTKEALNVKYKKLN